MNLPQMRGGELNFVQKVSFLK